MLFESQTRGKNLRHDHDVVSKRGSPLIRCAVSSQTKGGLSPPKNQTNQTQFKAEHGNRESKKQKLKTPGNLKHMKFDL